MKNLFFAVSVIGLCVAFTSCSKDSVSPSSVVNTSSKTTSNTGGGSEGVTPTTTTSDTSLQNDWTVVSDSCYWAGELPKYLVHAYKGSSGDSFNFNKDGKLYIKEDGQSDTATYSTGTNLITVIYPDAGHFNEAPGFGLQLDPVGYDPTISAFFSPKYIDDNTLILSCSMGTPDGAATRVIYLKK